MRTVPVVEAKAKFSALLAEVAQGEEIAITRHGQVIARLVPESARMAADVFRTYWNEGDIDLEAPADRMPEPVAPLD